MIQADQLESIAAADVRSSDDEKVGSVGQVFLDPHTGNPEWAAVKTGFFGTKEAFVPLRNAEWDGRVVRVAYDKERIKSAPHVDPDNRGIDPDQQVELYTYYGFTEAGSPQGTSVTGADPTVTMSTSAEPERTPAPEQSLSAVAMSEIQGRDTATDTPAEPPPVIVHTDDAGADVIRSEEQLAIGLERHATERVRLSKHVVTEQRTVTVTVRREELRIERIPISADDAAGFGPGDGIGESETEIVLYEEHPVVTTVTRPIERVRLSREVHSEQQTVTGDVREERVEVEGAGVTNDRTSVDDGRGTGPLNR